MKLSISVAGLSDELRLRLELASKLLAAHRIRAHLQDWDGTKCGLVVVDLADAYGLRVMDLALRREIPVYAFATGNITVDERVRLMPHGLSVKPMAQRLQELMMPPDPVASETSDPLLVTLARNPAWSSGDVAVTHGKRRILLCRSSSRVWANTLSDLLYCKDRFGLHDWQLQPISDPHTIHSDEQFSSSLDSFLTEAALAASLPTFMPGRWRLTEWPDLGAAPEVVVSLRAASLLLRQPMSAIELGGRLGIDDVAVSACLWALLATGLLRSEEGAADPSPTPVVTSPIPAGGLLARLARRFGLM
ncbi:MAG TPA: hypothetical protein VGV14_04155 [Rhodanobacter sp.]|nr:hypothetical protein [Rhodanobacter sp.]